VHNFPGAKSPRGYGITTGCVEKSQHVGAKLVSCTGRHLTLLRPWSNMPPKQTCICWTHSVYTRGLKHAGCIWLTRAFCAVRAAFGNFRIINVYVYVVQFIHRRKYSATEWTSSFQMNVETARNDFPRPHLSQEIICKNCS